MNRAMASSMVTLRLLRASSDRRLTSGFPRWFRCGFGGDWWVVVGECRVQDPQCLLHDRKVGGVHLLEHLTHAVRIQLAEALQGLDPVRRRGHHDMAPIARSLVALHQPEFDEAVHLAGCRRIRDAQPPGQLGHAQRSARDDQVHRLGLGHRELDQVEFGRVGRHEALHQRIEDAHDTLEVRRIGRTTVVGHEVVR